MAPEDFVLIAGAAVCALQTADEQQGHASRNHGSESVAVVREPMQKAMHISSQYH
jgi:hypothetical protein